MKCGERVFTRIGEKLRDWNCKFYAAEPTNQKFAMLLCI